MAGRHWVAEEGSASVRPELLRAATALAHTVPGVALELLCCDGGPLVVAYGRLDAQLTPCQLRCALLTDRQPGLPRLIDAIAAVAVSGGIDHLGGGIYSRGGGSFGTERWLVSFLSCASIRQLIRGAPAADPFGDCAVQLTPDDDLGVTVVRIEPGPGASVTAAQLDEVAFWVLSTCLVAELDEARHHVHGYLP